MPLLPETIHVWRETGGGYRVHWETTDPDTTVALQALDTSGGVLHSVDACSSVPVSVPARLSPHLVRFRLSDGHGNTVTVAARGQGLAGGVNFRDFGGYPLADGGSVRWGRLFRSGHLSRLTDEDIALTSELGIDLICDFRRDDERLRQPTRLEEPRQVHIAVTPGSHGSALYQQRRAIDSREAMFRFMVAINREFVHAQSEAYASMFRAILDSDAERILLHCAAGKDRTGFGAALLLLALGVSRDAVMNDYLLTRHYYDPVAEIPRVRRQYRVDHLDDDAVSPMLEVHEAYLSAALTAIDEDFGGVDAYLGEALQISDADRDTLVRRFTLQSQND